MKSRKIQMMLWTVLAMLALTGCACSGTTPATPTPQPSAITATPIPSESPMQSMLPSPEATNAADGESSATPETGGMAVDAAKLVEELEKLSEVDTADVVTEGNRAIIGLHFDAQYQGTLTERIEEMVVETTARVEAALTDVAVTADPTLVTEIKTLSQETKESPMTDAQKTQFDELYRKIKPGDTQTSAQ